VIDMDKVYDVEVSRYGKWWMVAVPELDLLTQARRLSEVETSARECIAVWLDARLSTVKVHLAFASSDEVKLDGLDAELAALAQEKGELERLSKVTSEKSKRIAKLLRDANVPVRDIGTVLHVSHQRAHQLIGNQTTHTQAAAKARRS